MPHYRIEYRNAARLALMGHPRFFEFTAPKVWVGAIDFQSLPIMGILTPQESSQRDSHSSTKRGTLLQVAVRRAGGEDIEDVLDDDSDIIEALVVDALQSRSVGCLLEDTSLVTNTNAEMNVGTLVMNFRLQMWRPVATLS